MAKRILLVGPTAFDDAETAHVVDDVVWTRFAAYDTSRPQDVDVVAVLDEARRRFAPGDFDGVIGTHDYPASLLAAAIGERLQTPSTTLAAMLRAQHKAAARDVQRQVVPDLLPMGWVLAARPSAAELRTLRYPLFARPAKSVTSLLARRVDDEADLKRYLQEAEHHLQEWVAPFNALWRHASMHGTDATCVVLEDLLSGVQTTVEGYVQHGRATTLGVVDSVMFDGTQSFARFDHPSTLPDDVTRRMREASAKVAEAHQLESTLFNVEWFYDDVTGQLSLIELNPRMSYQFCDLFHDVDGVNTYGLQAQLACGDNVTFTPGQGAFNVGISFVLRYPHDRQIATHPTQAQLDDVKAAFPDARVHLFGKPGQWLSELPQDAWRFRAGIVNVGGADLDDASRRCGRLLDGLDFSFVGDDPVWPPPV